MTTISVKRLSLDSRLPTRTNPDDAGLDLYSLDSYWLAPGEGAVVPTGVAIGVPKGHVGLICDRSSMAKKGFKTASGVIDSGYTGEVGVAIQNLSDQDRFIAKGDKVAQLLLMPIITPSPVEVTELEISTRGDQGWGSSGA